MNLWIENALNKYQNFLEENGASRTGNSKDLQNLVYAMGYFLSLMDQETRERWRQFMSLFARFWLEEECMARPGVSIVHFELPSVDIPFWKSQPIDNRTVTIRKFENFQNRFDEDVAHHADYEYTLYPLLHLQRAEFSSSQESLWEVVYLDENIPETFQNIPLFIHCPENASRAYEIAGFFRNAKSEVECRVPLYSFVYPQDEVPVPYRFSFNQLMDYPTYLDFFLEIQGLQKKHFSWVQEEECWKARIRWQGQSPLSNFREVSEENIPLHTLPVFHWMRKKLQTVQHRQRVLFDIKPEEIIWLKLGSHSELQPMPYYLMHSLDKRSMGYIKWKEDFLELEVTPNLGEGDLMNPIYIEAITIAQEEITDDYKGLKTSVLAYIHAIQANPLFSSTNDQKILQDHQNFLKLWRTSLRRYDISVLKQFLEEYCQSFEKHIYSMELSPVCIQYVPGKGMFPVIPVHISFNQLTEEIWFRIRRLYEYLKERSPLDILPSLEIHDTKKTKQWSFFSIGL